MIKFGIPSVSAIVDRFPGESVLTMHPTENEKSKRKFTLSKQAAEKLGINPGLSKVAFSFEGENLIGKVNNVSGIPSNQKYLVNKELSFFNKSAYDYIAKKFSVEKTVGNNFNISEVESLENGVVVGRFNLRKTPTTTETVSLSEENLEV